MNTQSSSEGASGSTGPLFRSRYAAVQGARVAWYAAHYALLRRATGPLERPDEPALHSDAPPPDRRAVRAAFRALFDADRANIEAGLYPEPRDFNPAALMKALSASRAFFKDSREVQARRLRRGGTEARDLAPKGRYPNYYLQNFHYQTDGWLSRRSARLYDTQVEVLFTGTADVMRRAALAEIAREIRGRDQRGVRLLDVACGTGRFAEQTLDAFPRLDCTGIDLSPAYVEEAGERLARWPNARVEEGNAEALGFGDGGYDVVVCIYLFHELPPRVRVIVAEEIARLVRPGGLVVFADSVQTGDDPNLDRMLEHFPRLFHEPYYGSYCETDLDALWSDAGLTPERQTHAFLTKVRTYRKPE